MLLRIKNHGYFEDIVGYHGRIEQCKVWVTDDVNWLVDRHPAPADLKSIQSIIVVQSIRDVKGKGETEELRFYISNKAGVGAQKMANAIRSH